MMKIGAELADGFILGFPATLETCREYCQEARKLFKEMGRSTLPDVVVINRIAISNDVDDALRALESSKNLIVRAPEEVRKAGFPELASRLEKQLSETKDIGRVSVSLSHLIPNEVVEKLSIVGPAEECVKKLRKYAELGIKHIILADYSPNQKWAFEVFQKEILPKIKDKEVE
jgi:alkanesulfonate monooxygenase SsuD/methylene tetrahydromethanopterin reductase-like flavin-dependent oxidoreductase (luciferase family)